MQIDGEMIPSANLDRIYEEIEKHKLGYYKVLGGVGYLV